MKKRYVSPVLMLTAGGHDISYGNSQGTYSGDSDYTWEVSQEDQDIFWVTYDETDLPDVDKDHDHVITQAELDEFMGW